MDKDLVARKLDSLARCLARLEAKRPASAADLAGDLDCQDILSGSVDWERVHNIVHHRLDDFRAFATHVTSLSASD